MELEALIHHRAGFRLKALCVLARRKWFRGELMVRVLENTSGSEARKRESALNGRYEKVLPRETSPLQRASSISVTLPLRS